MKYFIGFSFLFFIFFQVTFAQENTSLSENEYAKKKAELLNYTKNHLTEDSKKVGKKYVENYLKEEIFFLEFVADFFSLHFENVKSITVKSDNKNLGEPFAKAEFDRLGNLIFLSKNSLSESDDNFEKTFKYENGFLKSIHTEAAINSMMKISDDDLFFDKSVMFTKFRDDSFRKYYINDNGFLLFEIYHFIDDEHRIETEKFGFEKGKLVYKNGNDVEDLEFDYNNGKNLFPVQIKNNGDIILEVIERKPNEFEIVSKFPKASILKQEGKILKITIKDASFGVMDEPHNITFDYVYEYY